MATANPSKSASSPPNSFGNPDFDPSEVLSQSGPPSTDIENSVDERRERVDVVPQANQSFMSGWEALTHNQAQIFQETIECWREAMQQSLSAERSTPEQQDEIVRQRMEENIEGHFGARDRKNE